MHTMDVQLSSSKWSPEYDLYWTPPGRLRHVNVGAYTGIQQIWMSSWLVFLLMQKSDVNVFWKRLEFVFFRSFSMFTMLYKTWTNTCVLSYTNMSLSEGSINVTINVTFAASVILFHVWVNALIEYKTNCIKNNRQ